MEFELKEKNFIRILHRKYILKTYLVLDEKGEAFGTGLHENCVNSVGKAE
jgi:hypothetical protein